MLGKDGSNILYVIDFGLAQEYSINGKHCPEKLIDGIVGTTRYMSVSAHNKKEQSRRDDLESIGYMLIYLAKGELPWQSTPDKKYKGEQQIEIIEATSTEE